MSMQVIENAIKAKDTKTLCDLMALITEGLRKITTVDKPSVSSEVTADETLKKRVWGLAIDYIKRHGEEGRSQLLNSIVVPTLGVPKTFTDCTDDDLKAIEAQLLKGTSDG